MKMEEPNDIVHDVPREKLSLKLHEFIKLAQNQNGLRHGDFQRYRQYCSRRLRRLRTSLKFTHGKGRQFQKREVTSEEVETVDHLLIILLNCERCWAYAMQLKEDSRNAKVSGHASRKLSKAVSWSKRLQEVCTETGDDSTILESTAYSAWLQGSLLLEKESWEQALDQFSNALTIYSNLSEVGSLVEQDLFNARAQTIEPNIRFCRYALGGGAGGGAEGGEEGLAAALVGGGGGGGGGLSGILRDKLARAASDGRRRTADALHEVLWLGRPVPLRSRALKEAIVKADELRAGLAGSGAGDGALGAAALAAHEDALRLAQREAAALHALHAGAKVDEQRAEMEATQAYLQYGKWSCLNKRNQFLADSLERRWAQSEAPADPEEEESAPCRPHDLVHVYDVLLQGVRAMLRLPGADEDDDLTATLSIEELKIRALRCYYLAEAFAADSKWAEALGLLERAEGLGGAAAARADREAVLAPPARAALAADLARLQALAGAARLRCRARAALQRAPPPPPNGDDRQLAESLEGLKLDGKEAKKKRSVPLIDRLSVFAPLDSDANLHLVDIPPHPSYVPAKPILLDIAYNHIKFPDLDEKCGIKKATKEGGKESTEEGTGSRGILGWLTGR